jgi:ribosomal protein L12E/L44/L45/RPP1/RPP2
MEASKVHGNVKLGYCNECENQNQDDFYPGKKYICKTCYGNQVAEYKKKHKAESPKPKPKKESLTTVAEQIAEHKKDSDQTLALLQAKLEEQTLLIKQLAEQVALCVKPVPQKAGSPKRKPAEEAQQPQETEEQEEDSAPFDPSQAKQYYDLLVAIENRQRKATIAQLRDMADYIKIKLPKSNATSKEDIIDLMKKGLKTTILENKQNLKSK